MVESRTGASRFLATLWAEPLVGAFIALEGVDGSGKSTLARRLHVALQSAGVPAILTREPGGTAIGEQIRTILLGAPSSSMLPTTEMLLFAAARAQLVGEVIKPALQEGLIVVSDRFSDSSLAYQWGARGLAKASVLQAQEIATGGIQPDLKILLDVPVEAALKRRMAVDHDLNRLDREAVEFHRRVREAYHLLAEADPERWRIIDADRDEDAVWPEVWQAVASSALFAKSVGSASSAGA